MSKRVIVVVRQAAGLQPVASFVKEEEVDGSRGVAATDEYLEECAERHIEWFKKDFVEFSSANFYTYILDL